MSLKGAHDAGREGGDGRERGELAEGAGVDLITTSLPIYEKHMAGFKPSSSSFLSDMAGGIDVFVYALEFTI